MQGALEGFEEDSAPIRVAGVIVDADLAHLDRPLDYEIPEELADRVEVGVLVRVRLAGRRMNGWVLNVRTEHPIHRVNPIEAVVSALPLVTPEIFAAARRISALAAKERVWSSGSDMEAICAAVGEHTPCIYKILAVLYILRVLVHYIFTND